MWMLHLLWEVQLMPLLAYSCYGGGGLPSMQEGIERIKLVYVGFVKKITLN